MSLKISESNGIFFLNGKLNTSTLKSFTTYIEYNLVQKKNVIVNIDNVIEIDRESLATMKKFTEIAVLEEKIFSIVGYGCKEIYDDFNQTNVA